MAAAQITTGTNITGDFDVDVIGAESGIGSGTTLYRSLGASTTNWEKVQTFRAALSGYVVRNVGENSYKVVDTNTSGLTVYWNQ